MKKSLLVPLVAAFLTGCATSSAEPPDIAASTSQPLSLGDVFDKMAEHKLAGLSVAVFDDYQIIETRTFGTKQAGLDDPIAEETAFSTASISKPVTALLALLLDAEGVIDIDAPVARYLKRWQLPASSVANAQNVTMRQLLTHMGGTSQHGFADFYEGDEVPTLVDSLEGQIPRYDKPIEFLFEPGTSWKYSGGGYVIVQVAIEDQTGRSLAELAREKIFNPLGMNRTTMAQPGEAGFLSDVAKVHDESGSVIRSGLPITPQISASGMWSTPADLARFAIAIQRGLAGDIGKVVTPEIAAELTKIVTNDHVGGMAMPFFRGFGFGNTDWFRHDGSNTGVNADLMASMGGGYGFILMGNGDDPNTGPVFAFLRQKIIREMRWSDRIPLAAAPIPTELARAISRDYNGLLYGLGLPYTIEAEGDKLWIKSAFFEQFLGKNRSEMTYLGDGVFAVADYPNRLRFNLSDDGLVEAVTLFRPGYKASSITRTIENQRK